MSLKSNDDTLQGNAEKIEKILKKYNYSTLFYLEDTPSNSRHFSTGARRDDDTGKPKLTYIPWDIMDRVANHYERGALKYSDENWRRGIPSSTVLDSLMRHVRQYYMGCEDDDHLSAIVFNALCLIYNEEKMSDNADVYDLPKWWKDRGFR